MESAPSRTQNARAVRIFAIGRTLAGIAWIVVVALALSVRGGVTFDLLALYGATSVVMLSLLALWKRASHRKVVDQRFVGFLAVIAIFAIILLV